MLWLNRRAALLNGQAWKNVAQIVLDDDWRIYVVTAHGLRFDSRTLPAPLHGVRPRLLLQIGLEGRLVLRRGAPVVVERGQVVAERAERWDERWLAPTMRALVIECRNPDVAVESSNAFRRSRLRPTELSYFDRLARGLEDRSLVDARRDWSTELFHRLENAGLIARGAAPKVTWHAASQPVADAVSAALSSLHTAPSWADLASSLKTSERTGRRHLWTLSPMLDPARPTLGMRERFVLERVRSAVQLLTASDTSVECVARSVGYGSSRAMLRAFASLNVATPSMIRDMAWSSDA